MSLRTLGQLPGWLVITLGSAGCFLDADGLGQKGGAGPTGGGPGSGAGVQGGSGSVACETASDCPQAGECSVAECTNGACSEVFDPIDTPCGDGTTEACDGSGMCVGIAGHPCSTVAECMRGACADGVCCDTECDTLCSSCSQPGFEGTCTPYAPAENPEGCAPGTCDGAGECASGVALAADAIGSGNGDSFVVALDVVNPGGDVVLAGYFSQTTNAGGSDLVANNGYDALVVRLDDAGAHLWSKRFGEGSDQFVRDVATSPAGDVVISGDFYGSADFGGGALGAQGRDAFLVELDPDGNHVWSKRFGDGPDQTLNVVAVASNGDVLAAGDFSGTVDFGGGPLTSAGSSDIAVVRLDAAGNHVWSKRFGDGSDQHVSGIDVDADGNTWLTGFYTGGLDFGGGALANLGSYDIFLAKLDVDGNHLFSARFGDGGDQRSRTIAVGPNGSVAIAGGVMGVTDFGGGPLTSSGNYDAFVALFDDAGGPEWSLRFGDNQEQQAWGVAIDAGGSVVVSGEMGGAADFGGGQLASLGSFDVFAAKFAADSTHLWSQRYGDSNIDYNNDLAVSPDGSLWMLGSFYGVLDFASGGQLANAGGLDSFWAHLLP